MKKIAAAICLFAILGSSCNSYKYSTLGVASINNNVCKKLQGKVVLYAIFVDSKHMQPWSAYDIKSTIDSIDKAKHWLEKQAAANGISLQVDIRIHKKGNTIPLTNNLPDKSLQEALYSPNLQFGIAKINRWADRTAAMAGQSLPKDTSAIIQTPNKVTNRERLIARLRDLHQTDNVALLYFVNNYYKEDVSVAIHTSSHTEIEYGIVSYKYPGVIAHEFLHLFGAWDLYVSPFLKKHKAYIQKDVAEKVFPNEVMAFADRNLESLEISGFTKYLIGWQSEMDEKYQKHFSKWVKFRKN